MDIPYFQFFLSLQYKEIVTEKNILLNSVAIGSFCYELEHVLFNNLNWLPFTKQSLINRCALVYKRVHNYITPSYLNSLLVRNSEIHNRATRHSNINLICPKYKRKKEGGRAVTIRTIKDWNCMNANIRNNGSLASFKHNVFKSFLAEQKAAMLLRL